MTTPTNAPAESPQPRKLHRDHVYGTGTVYLPKDRRTWWISYYADGRQQQESAHSHRRRDAAKLLQRRLAAISEGRPTGREGRKLTLAELRELLHEDYIARGRKSWRRASEVFRAVTAVFGETCRVSSITSDRLHQYRQTQLEAGFAPATVQQQLAALKRSLNIAVERGLLPFHVRFPRMGMIQNARTEFIEPFEWALLRPELPDVLQDLFTLGLEMGWRCRGEVRPLTWAQVDWDRGLVRLEPGTTKNNDGRLFPFRAAPAVQVALERRRAATDAVEQETGRPVPWVFHDAQGAVLSQATFYTGWRRACKKAAVLGADGKIKRPHDLRRSAVRALEVGGVPRSVAKRLVGHRTDSMYQRYAITTTDDLREAVQRLHAPPTPAPEGTPA